MKFPPPSFYVRGITRYLAELRRRNKLIAFWGMKLFRRPRTFEFAGRRYTYFWHRYNSTWRNERAVEIPIALAWLEEQRGRRVLEVGNVLSHYTRVTHDVVDKYEKAPGVINEDVVDFRPPSPYGAILSISTLEHVGWDEPQREPMKVLAAFQNLERILAPGGRMLATFPVGYNSTLDDLVMGGKMVFSRFELMKRASKGNDWRAATWEEARNAGYNHWLPAANAALIGFINKAGNSA